VMGLILVANMSLTWLDQLLYLVVFSTASLFLLIGMHAFDERTAWLRRRIGDPASVSRLYLQGGTVFIVVAIASSLVLTDRASSAPLAAAWRDLDQRFYDAAQSLQRFLPEPGEGVRPFGGVNFGSTSVITGRWEMNDGVAFRTQIPANIERLYWRAVVYDRFDLTTWTVGADARAIEVPRDDVLLEQTAELPDEALTDVLTFTIRPDTYRENLLLSPASPVLVDRDVRVTVVGEDGWLASIAGAGRDPYTVTALIRKRGNDAINVNRLRQAGQDYPADVMERYLQVPAGAIPEGGAAEALLASILEQGTDNPYDLAKLLERELQSPANYTYDADVSDLNCREIGVVECFALYKRGYCQHYASTMAILLREAGIPTRMASGFLPGERALGTGEEVVFNRGAHAWVEVYFPGYGWQPFDPTGGGLAALPELPLGPSDVERTPLPSLNAPTRPPEASETPAGVTPGGGGPNQPTGDAGLLILVTLVLGLAILAAALAAWWRSPRQQVSPEGAWVSIERLSRRLGFGRRPTQTTYEYAASLGELLPDARPDLEVVAQARVQVAYGRTSLAGDQLRLMQEAAGRLRVTLLRLVLRRPGGRKRRGG
jgi:transglutaminase-like putative cysteine protease